MDSHNKVIRKSVPFFQNVGLKVHPATGGSLGDSTWESVF